MFEWRIYRAALAPVALAIVVAAFSLAAPPPPLSATLAPDAFDGARAFGTLQDLASRFPSRRPGSAADFGLARVVHRLLAARPGSSQASPFEITEHRFRAQTIDGARDLVTVIGRRLGSSSRQIVVLAHRDAARPGSLAELSGTAALLELAHVASQRVMTRTLTLVSTSGGSGGDAGAAEFARRTGGPVDAVLVLGDLAGRSPRRPQVVGFSDGPQLAPLSLKRTLDTALNAEVGHGPGGASVAVQFARLAFPVTVGEQGPLLAAHLPAALVSVSGERGPRAGEQADQATLQQWGRAALRAVGALDAGRDLTDVPGRDLELAPKVFPGWAVRVLLGALILAPLLVSIDGCARARRRHQPLALGIRWALTLVLPFAVAAAFAMLAGRLGLLGPAPPHPPGPGALPVNGLALGAVGLVFVLCWLARRPLAERLGVSSGSEVARAPGTGPALLLMLSLLALVVWALNPFAAVLLVPALHVWLAGAAPEVRLHRGLAVILMLIGMIPLVLLVVSLAVQFGLGPLQLAWIGLLVLAGGHVGPVAAALWSLAFGGAAAVFLVAVRGDEPAAPSSTLGPRTPLVAAGQASGRGRRRPETLRGR